MYGGTKTEMERLLADAEKLSGVHYDISSYSDVVEAIHQIQTNMGIAGTTAEEAATTIEGSVNTMKAAWQNLLTGLGDPSADVGQLTQNFADSFATAAENIVPRIGAILKGIGDVIPAVIPVIAEQLPALIGELLPAILQGAINLIQAIIVNLPTLLQAIFQAIVNILQSLWEMIKEVFAPVVEFFSGIFQGAVDAISSIWSGITDFFSGIWDGIKGVFSSVGNWFKDRFTEAAQNSQQTWSNTITFFSNIWNGIKGVFSSVSSWFSERFTEAATNAQNAWSGITSFFSGIWEGIKGAFSAVGSWFSERFTEAATNAQNAWNGITSFFSGVWNGIKGAFASVSSWFSEKFTAAKTAIQNAFGAVKSYFVQKWEEIKSTFRDALSKFSEVGRNIVQGIKNGIIGAWSSFVGWVKEKARGILDAAKAALGIASPSKLFRDEVGVNIGLGIAEGIDKSAKTAEEAAEELAQGVYDKSKEWLDKQVKYQKMSLKDQLEVWQTIQSQFVKGSKQYTSAEQEITSVREKLIDEYYSTVESTQKKIEDLQKNYDDTLAKNAQSIMNSYKLFDQIKEREVLNGEDLTRNLQGQVNMITLFYDGIKELQDRGVGQAMVDEIKAMGPSAIDELTAILAMSDDKLQEYSELYAKKQELANQYAEEGLKDLKADTEAQIKEQMDSLNSLYDEYAPYVGESLTDGMAKGIMDGMSTVVNAAVQVAQNAIKAVRETLGIHSPSKVFSVIGDNMALGLAQGWTDTYNRIEGVITNGLNFENSSANFAKSYSGISSAGIINGMSAQSGGGEYTFNIVLPDGTKLATYLFNPLVNHAKANGTPILNPT